MPGFYIPASEAKKLRAEIGLLLQTMHKEAVSWVSGLYKSVNQHELGKVAELNWAWCVIQSNS